MPRADRARQRRDHLRRLPAEQMRRAEWHRDSPRWRGPACVRPSARSRGSRWCRSRGAGSPGRARPPRRSLCASTMNSPPMTSRASAYGPSVTCAAPTLPRMTRPSPSTSLWPLTCAAALLHALPPGHVALNDSLNVGRAHIRRHGSGVVQQQGCSWAWATPCRVTRFSDDAVRSRPQVRRHHLCSSRIVPDDRPRNSTRRVRPGTLWHRLSLAPLSSPSRRRCP